MASRDHRHRTALSSIQLLRDPDDVLPFLDEVCRLADANRHELGFFPPVVYRESAQQGRLWLLAGVTRQGLAGFLRFGGSPRQLKVHQLFVAHDCRRSGLARRLVRELVLYGEERSVLSIRARVAADLDANRFWRAAGFRAVRREPGGQTTGRQLNIYVRDLNVPSLLSLASSPTDAVVERQDITYPPRPLLATASYVLDLNVLFDALRERDQGESRRLLTAALNSTVRLAVTAEFARELERASADLEHDDVLRGARALPTLPAPPASELRRLKAELRVLFPTPSGISARKRAADSSDLSHLASCIYHRAYGFVTRDGRILRAAKSLLDRHRLRVLLPTDLAPTAASGQFLAPTRTAELARSSFTVHSLRESERADAEGFLRGLGLADTARRACLDPGTEQQPTARRVVRAEKKIVGIASLSAQPTVGQPVIAHVLVDDFHPEASVIAEHLIDWVVTPRTHGHLFRLELQTAFGQTALREVARDAGFLRTQASTEPPQTLTKIAFGGFITPARWSSFAADFEELSGYRLPEAMPSWDELKLSGVGIAKQGAENGRLPVLDFETLISPGLLLAKGRGAVVVPIKPAYADSLLPPTAVQTSFLPVQEAYLRIERAYFRRADGHRLFSDGEIVAFYVSEPRSEMTAVARTTFADTLTVEQTMIMLARQGVLSKAELERRAGRGRKLTAFTFSGLTTLNKSIPIGTLRELGCVGPKNYVEPEPLAHEQLRMIVTHGFEGATL